MNRTIDWWVIKGIEEKMNNVDKNTKDRIIQQLVFERTQMEGGKQMSINKIAAMDNFVKNKTLEREAFQLLKIIGYDKMQKDEIAMYKKASEVENQNLVQIRDCLVSLDKRLEIIKK